MKKYINGEYIEMTTEEIAELQSMQMELPIAEPNIEERVEAIEEAIMELAEVMFNG